MRFVLALAVFAGLSALAHAQLRTIPAEASRGEMRHLQDMVIELDGRQARLAPGAQIRDTSNRIVLPASVTETMVVKYLLDGTGAVHRVWILSAREAAADQPAPKPAPAPAPKPPAEKPAAK